MSSRMFKYADIITLVAPRSDEPPLHMALDLVADCLRQLVAHRPLVTLDAIVTLLGSRSSQSLIDDSH